MQHEVLSFAPHFIDETLNTKAECVKDSLLCRKYMFLAKTFALRSMGIQLVSILNVGNMPFCVRFRPLLEISAFYS